MALMCTGCRFPAGCTERVAEVLCDPKLWMVHACLALLGGSFQVGAPLLLGLLARSGLFLGLLLPPVFLVRTITHVFVFSLQLC